MMWLASEYLKKPTKIILELTNEFSKVPEHQITARKSHFHMLTKNHEETKIQIMMPLTIAPEEIKYLDMFKT